ncbi:MAG: ABC transporter ATP-binding protein [Desulfosarcinaceae bacterium]
MTDYAVEIRDVTKTFPLVTANDDVTLLVEKGEIHALVGENGAGKSTLMNILYGLLQPDSGTLAIGGRSVRFNGPAEAIKAGIGMVHQHFMLIPSLTVAENVVLGQEPARHGMIDMDAANETVRSLSDRYGLKVDPAARVETLSVGIEQRIEIIKVLYRGADILILDEPTAVLAPQEVEEFFEILKALKAQGKTIIFITHKLHEVMAISDRVTVMRHGKMVGAVETAKTSKAEIATLMVGRQVLLQVDRGSAKPGETALQVEALEALDNKGLPVLKGVDLTVRTGEILGIAGVEGNGQTELVEVLTGLRPSLRGRVAVAGREIGGLSPRQVRASGVGHIPEDRHRRGLVLEYTVADNTILGIHYQPPFVKSWGVAVLDPAPIQAKAERLVAEFDIRPTDPQNLAGNLSGGNQQKVVVAREMDQQPKLLIAAQPTRGVDVGSIEFIHKRLIEARDAGAAVLLVSADLDEVLSLADRIAVIYEGQIVGELVPEEATEERLGLLMTGAG